MPSTQHPFSKFPDAPMRTAQRTHTSYPSAHAIGERVVAFEGYLGEIVAVTFTVSKVLYDVALDEGGEIVQRVDSTFVKAAN
jgi:hypothetical protein